MFLVKVYIAIHKFDITCISEIYFDSGTPSDDSNLEIYGYAIVHLVQPSNNKRGGVCIYYKSFLPFQCSIELSMSNIFKKVYVLNLKLMTKLVTFYLSTDLHAKVKMSLKLFTENLELNLENSVQWNLFLVVAIRDFNTTSSNWFCQDRTNFEGDEIEILTSQFGLPQVIKEPTHILDTSSWCMT